jgi:hypothetical protein
MGTTYRFLAIDNEIDVVFDWFRRLPQPPEEFPRERRTLLYFREFGALAYEQCGAPEPQVDSRRSPLVSVFAPRLRRGVLWTAGEVHFLATPLRQLYPQLHRVSQQFRKWLTDLPSVFSRKVQQGEWDYYLEGSLRNYDPEIYAFPRAMEALRRGQYFISDGDTDGRIETVCRELRKRGIQCVPAEPTLESS